MTVCPWPEQQSPSSFFKGLLAGFFLGVCVFNSLNHLRNKTAPHKRPAQKLSFDFIHTLHDEF